MNIVEGLITEYSPNPTHVLRRMPGQITPYYLRLKIWKDIFRRHTDPTPDEVKKYGTPTKNGKDKIFEVREVERDTSFLRRYLTEEMMRELDMFQYEARGDDYVVSKVSDEDNWKTVKETLIKNVGTGSIPVIKI